MAGALRYGAQPVAGRQAPNQGDYRSARMAKRGRAQFHCTQYPNDKISPHASLLKTPAGRYYNYRLHETTVHPTFGTVLVSNKNPLSLSLAEIEDAFRVRRNHIDDGRVLSWRLSHFEGVIRSDVYYRQFSSFVQFTRIRRQRRHVRITAANVGCCLD